MCWFLRQIFPFKQNGTVFPEKEIACILNIHCFPLEAHVFVIKLNPSVYNTPRFIFSDFFCTGELNCMKQMTNFQSQLSPDSLSLSTDMITKLCTSTSKLSVLVLVQMQLNFFGFKLTEMCNSLPLEAAQPYQTLGKWDNTFTTAPLQQHQKSQSHSAEMTARPAGLDWSHQGHIGKIQDTAQHVPVYGECLC